jgi:hypothetical protein
MISCGLLFESVWGLPDLQFRCQVCGEQIAYLIVFAIQQGWWRRGDSNS